MTDVNFNNKQLEAAQRLELFFSEGNRDNFLLSGYPGTGKTFVLSQMLQEISPSIFDLAVCAFTHKAKGVAQAYLNSIGLDYSVFTINKLLGLSPDIDEDGKQEFSKQSERPPIYNYRYVWVDECSMINADLFMGLQGKPVRYIYTGDQYQLLPINEVSFPVFDYFKRSGHPHIHLTKPERYSGPIADVVYEGLYHVMNRELFRYENYCPYTDDCTYKSKWFDDWVDNPNEKVVLTFTNNHVDTINQKCRDYVLGVDAPEYVVGEQLLTYAPIYDSRGAAMVPNGEIITVSNVEQNFLTIGSETFKAWELKLLGYSETIRTVFKSERKPLKKYLDQMEVDAKAKKIYWPDYYAAKGASAVVKPTYALTIHKSQGSGYHSVYVVDSFRFCKDRDLQPRLHYVAMSRAKSFLCYSSRP